MPAAHGNVLHSRCRQRSRWALYCPTYFGQPPPSLRTFCRRDLRTRHDRTPNCPRSASSGWISTNTMLYQSRGHSLQKQARLKTPWYITTSASAWRGSPPSTTGVGASAPLGHQARQEPTPDAHTNQNPNPCKGNTPETPGRCKHWARFAIQLYLIRRN